ncbi:MAG: tetratricopeptide repeat protein [Bacteroidales bacterium]|nr:tetratricopeptide repeat protein [Bacteroidales bacterium]
MKRLFFLTCMLLCGICSGLAQVRVELSPDGPTLRPLEMSDYDRHEPARRLTRQDSVDYSSHVARAFNYLAADSLAQARMHLEQALRLWPEAPGTWILRHNLGRIALAEGRHAAAYEEFTRILKKLPEERTVRKDRAAAALELGYTREALEDLNLLLANETSDSLRASLLFMRASARMKSRLYADARTDLKAVLSLQPASENAMLLLCAVDWQSGRRESALLMLGGFINAHPANTLARSMRAGFLAEQGRTEAAILDLEDALRIEPGNLEILQQRDNIVRQQRKRK